MAIMQMVVVACLGMKKAPGRSAERPRKESPERVRSWRGLIKGKGKMVISSMSKHSENDTKSLGLKRRRRGRWIHLNQSYGCGDMRCRRLGTFL